MAARPAVRLAGMIPLFARERFLSDYADDAKLCYRLNQVMRRVRLPALPERLHRVPARGPSRSRRPARGNANPAAESPRARTRPPNPIRSQ